MMNPAIEQLLDKYPNLVNNDLYNFFIKAQKELSFIDMIELLEMFVEVQIPLATKDVYPNYKDKLIDTDPDNSEQLFEDANELLRDSFDEVIRITSAYTLTTDGVVELLKLSHNFSNWDVIDITAKTEIAFITIVPEIIDPNGNISLILTGISMNGGPAITVVNNIVYENFGKFIEGVGLLYDEQELRYMTKFFRNAFTALLDQYLQEN